MDIIDSAKNAIESVQRALSNKNVLETAEVGDLNALELLIAQHREVDALFAAYEEAGEKAFRTKEKIYEKIAEKLRLHAELEEKHFYPSAERLDAALVREAEEEHQVLKEMLAKIDELAAEDSTFDAKVTVLKELIEHHVREEERELFPECKSKMPEEKLKEIGAIMHAETLQKDSSLQEKKSQASKTH
ncbi:MAG TPA: hemerythrin domain-containing protein [Oligoflexus sp.]|uniref:hemerythrin domain-containing protein n=1 Tax=Oligoflexus sp. TaxID=1971216 RepID=UPI002D7F813E|nr:hemerythrin domain-containing protein [Oligoflexus sp.]HET9236672.1 hemerythrin domain-containing protein [Oligoflexus sp.]